MSEYYTIPTQQGWECPKCGAVMAPWQSYCVNCKGANKTITTPNTTPNTPPGTTGVDHWWITKPFISCDDTVPTQVTKPSISSEDLDKYGLRELLIHPEIKSPCIYFTQEYDRKVCYGTKEKDEVSCNGDTDKC